MISKPQKRYDVLMIQRLITLLLMGIMLVNATSCNSNRCEGIDCQNDGICDFGECVCETGYYGDFCETMWIDKFLGFYQGTQDCASVDFVSNFKQRSVTGATLTNFANAGYELPFNLTSSTKVKFSNQLLGMDEYSGTGELTNDTLHIQYTVVKNIGTATEFIEDCALTYIQF